MNLHIKSPLAPLFTRKEYAEVVRCEQRPLRCQSGEYSRFVALLVSLFLKRGAKGDLKRSKSYELSINSQNFLAHRFFSIAKNFPA